MNQEFPDVQAGFRKDRNQRSNCQHPLDHRKSNRILEKMHTSASLTMLKPLTLDHNKLWKILKDTGTADHLTCLLGNLYGDQEATVRTRHVITDWFQIRKGVRQGYILSPCLSNLHAAYIM